jgi:FkbM family methyltransferase
MPGDTGPIDTIYGRFTRKSKRRLDLTFDYEAAEIAGFRRVAEVVQPTLLLDIGANIGVYAVYLGGIASLRRILAFEPAPDTFQMLKRNLALQGDTRMVARNEALSDRAGSAQFAVFGALAGNNALSDTAASGNVPETTIKVSTARLDDRLEAAGEMYVAKIDVEGHELQVLNGATRFLQANTGVLQIEAFRTVPDLDALLAELGYTRLFRMKHDYYYSNIPETDRRTALQEILFDEVATALGDLKDERRRRRAAIRASRGVVEQLRYNSDPVTGTKSGAK